jgi:hypothetical protein
VSELDDLLADSRAAAAATERQQRRRLQQLGEEEATLVGLLVDLAERGTPVTAETADGGAHRGVVRMVATDFCVLATDPGDVWIAYPGLVAVRPHPGERHVPATGRRTATDLSLAEALGRVAADRPSVRMVAAGGRRLSGELRSAGVDVLTVKLDGPDAGLVYVPVSSVRTLLRSG